MRARETSEEGFGLIELIVAMLLLAVLALALLPTLIGASIASSTNRSLVAANSFAAAQLAPIRAAFPIAPNLKRDCDDLRAFESTGIAGPEGSGLVADVTVGECADGAGPTAALVTVSVYRDSTATPLTTITTRVLVESE